MWITGLPSSGKSTIANGVAQKLREMGLKIEILESDELRKV
ncbi:MAG: adenylyl-sulfate kinase, partial [Candidatus Bathyarchaeia archaeon]